MRKSEFTATQSVAQDVIMREYGSGRTTKGHSEACRARIVADMSKTSEEQRRLQVSFDRIDRFIAEHIEVQDQVPQSMGGELMR